jgi:hypothetical protein
LNKGALFGTGLAIAVGTALQLAVHAVELRVGADRASVVISIHIRATA